MVLLTRGVFLRPPSGLQHVRLPDLPKLCGPGRAGLDSWL